MDSDYLNIPTPPTTNPQAGNPQPMMEVPPASQPSSSNKRSILPKVIGIIIVIAIIGIIAFTQINKSTTELNSANQTSQINTTCPCLSKAQFSTITNYSNNMTYSYNSTSEGSQVFTYRITPYGTQPPSQILDTLSTGYSVKYNSSMSSGTQIYGY